MIIGTAVGGNTAAVLVLLLFILCRRYRRAQSPSPTVHVHSVDHRVVYREVKPITVVQGDTSVHPSPTRKPRLSSKPAPHGDPPIDTVQLHTTAPDPLQPPAGSLIPRADNMASLEPQQESTVCEDVHLATERDTLARQVRDGEQHVAELPALRPSDEGYEGAVSPVDDPASIPLAGSAALPSGGNTVMMSRLEALQMEVARLRVQIFEAEINVEDGPLPAYEEDG